MRCCSSFLQNTINTETRRRGKYLMFITYFSNFKLFVLHLRFCFLVVYFFFLFCICFNILLVDRKWFRVRWRKLSMIPEISAFHRLWTVEIWVSFLGSWVRRPLASAANNRRSLAVESLLDIWEGRIFQLIRSSVNSLSLPHHYFLVRYSKDILGRKKCNITFSALVVWLTLMLCMASIYFNLLNNSGK